MYGGDGPRWGRGQAMNTCVAAFAKLSAALKDIRCDGDAFVTLHSTE